MKRSIILLTIYMLVFSMSITGAPADTCEATVNTPYEITISALENGVLNSDYRGTVIFKVDKEEDVIIPAKYTWTEQDAGNHTFTFTFLNPGLYTVYVYDITNGNTLSEKRVLVRPAYPHWTDTPTPTLTSTFTPTLTMTATPIQGECINIYVSDSGNHRIQVFDGSGNYIRQWGGYGDGIGEMKNPMGVFISEEGEVYVADNANHRIEVFDRCGKYLRQ